MSSAKHKHWFSNLIFKMYNSPVHSWADGLRYAFVGGLDRTVAVGLDFRVVFVFLFDDTHSIPRVLGGERPGHIHLAAESTSCITV